MYIYILIEKPKLKKNNNINKNKYEMYIHKTIINARAPITLINH